MNSLNTNNEELISDEDKLIDESIDPESENLDSSSMNSLPKSRKSIFEKWAERFKEFLDKA